MKALTLWQPWASLVAMGEKQVETRCWTTKYRGELAIHSAKNLPPKWLGGSSRTDPFRDELADVLNVRRDRDDRCGHHVETAVRAMPYGTILCVVKLLAVEEIDGALRAALSHREYMFGNYEDGRYAWFLEMVEKFDTPIPVKGNRLLWNWKGAESSRVVGGG